MNTAARVRKNREANPSLYCPQCLWRVQTFRGRKPCPTHQKAEIALQEDAESVALCDTLRASIAARAS